MKFPWQKNKEPAQGAVKMRAAIIPKSYHFQMMIGATENTFTVNSFSTHLITLQLLKPGQTAKSVALLPAGVSNFGGPLMSKEDEKSRNLQRVQFDAPNWIGVIVCADGLVYYDHVEVPVWADPATGQIHSVDVDALLLEQEPNRQRASEIWGETEGPFALYFQLKNAPREILETGKFLTSLPGTWFGAVKDMVDDMKGEGKPPEPLPDHMRPDLTQYPPIEDIDYETWALLSAKPEKIQELGVPQDKWVAANKEWMARTMKDWKLGAQYGNDIERVRKTKS